MKHIEILIPNRFSFNGICLTIESILKQTAYESYRITVCDNSAAENNCACEPHDRRTLNGDDGNRREYLRAMQGMGYIDLVEIKRQERRYGHGENIKVLLAQCNAEYALLFNSSTEIIAENWLNNLLWLFRTGRDLGIAKYRPGGIQDDGRLRPPVYWPNVMLLNMEIYRRYAEPDDFDLLTIPVMEFKYRKLFYESQDTISRISQNPLVFADTGWKLYARLKYENPGGFRMLPLPENFFRDQVRLFGGIDRNSHRPHIPYVQEKLTAINERLGELRKEAS